MNIKALSFYAIALGTLAACKTPQSSSSFPVARMQVKEPIEGVCDNENIIAILPFPDGKQVKAKAPKTEEELENMLNTDVPFLKENPTYSDKGMVNLIVNCHGEMVQCQIDNKTKHPELDAQIVAVFATLNDWVPGTVNGYKVDTSVLYSFTIENGKLSL